MEMQAIIKLITQITLLSLAVYGAIQLVQYLKRREINGNPTYRVDVYDTELDSDLRWWDRNKLVVTYNIATLAAANNLYLSYCDLASRKKLSSNDSPKCIVLSKVAPDRKTITELDEKFVHYSLTGKSKGSTK